MRENWWRRSKINKAKIIATAEDATRGEAREQEYSTWRVEQERGLIPVI
jgi:hypothetical protein